MKPTNEKAAYDHNIFTMLGGLEGIQALVDCFYDIMCERPEAFRIRHMHPPDLGPMRGKLALFLCGWLGGPQLYREKHGPIDLTGLHSYFEIGIAERDMWLSCMQMALDRQPIPDDVKIYLLDRFRVPADKIYSWCKQQRLQATDMDNRVQR